MEGRWLVISYFTGVDGMAASIHADMRIKELQARSVEVQVLSSMAAKSDHSMVQRVISLFPSGIRFEVRHVFRKRKKNAVNILLKSFFILLLFPFYALEKILLRFDPTWSWYLSASREGRKIAREFNPGVIYSTGGPASAHLVALAVKKASGAKWIAEFQDPLLHPTTYRSDSERKHFVRIEDAVAQHADAAVYVTEGARKRALDRVSFKGRTAVIYPGADSTQTINTNVPPDNGVIIAHIGTLAGTRNLDAMISGVNLLRKRDPDAESLIKVIQYGFTSREVMTSSGPTGDRIVFAGRVPHDEALMRMGYAHVLLLIQNADDVSRETIPSKVYEYLLTGKPILGLVFRNPELTSILKYHGHLAADIEDPSSIASALMRIVKDFRGGKLTEPVGIEPSITLSSSVEQLMKLTE
jgi:glycosyltransferase involved in cell wall biosynthesis